MANLEDLEGLSLKILIMNLLIFFLVLYSSFITRFISYQQRLLTNGDEPNRKISSKICEQMYEVGKLRYLFIISCLSVKTAEKSAPSSTTSLVPAITKVYHARQCELTLVQVLPDSLITGIVVSERVRCTVFLTGLPAKNTNYTAVS